jgi:cytochrome oxidase Cu insertion factor (SCO1/SenC/PrrC family)
MRNILMTVMLLIVTALLFTSIINNDNTGLRNNIQTKGQTANTNINALVP